MQLDLINALQNEIDEAQSRNMQRLLEGWAKEIAEEQRLQLEINQRKLREAAEEAALAQSISVDLAALREEAAGGGEGSDVGLPEGIRVASELISTPSIAQLNGLIGDIHQAHLDAQRSALWAVKHGALPHPGDLGAILDAVPADRAWAQRFHALAAELDTGSFRTSQLNAHLASRRLDACLETVHLLEQYGADRTLRMIANPMSLRDQPLKIAPLIQSPSPRMGAKAFHRMLDNLF